MLSSLTGEVTFVGDASGKLTIETTNTDGSMRSLGEILADCRVAFSQMSESEKAANAEALVGKNAMSGFLAAYDTEKSAGGTCHFHRENPDAVHPSDCRMDPGAFGMAEWTG